jgi:hypothetical protein
MVVPNTFTLFLYVFLCVLIYLCILTSSSNECKSQRKYFTIVVKKMWSEFSVIRDKTCSRLPRTIEIILNIQDSPVQIQALTRWSLIGRSMTALPPVLSPSSILPPLPSHFAFITEKIIGTR